MKMIRFSIPVLLILCCCIVCFSLFGTVDAQLKKDKPVDKPVGKRAGKPDKPVNLLKPDRTGKKAQPDNVQTKIGELENLVKKLKNQLDNSNAKQQDLLKKLAELEAKVKTHEKILPSILDQIARKIPDIPMGEIRRTCAEIRAMDFSIPSGMQWIDPDGKGVGETPIYVYCDMTTGSTTIKHDSHAPINVGHCAGAGCYSRPIKYEASMAQIKALTDLSSECRQSITYDCFLAPHKFQNTMYSWWNDRNGNSQYFFAGNNAYGIPSQHQHPDQHQHPHQYPDQHPDQHQHPHQHPDQHQHQHPHTMPICQCGIDGNCAVSSVMCNCDSLIPQQLSDKGVITSKNILPITRLNFGGTQSPSSSGIHTLGNLTCSGYSRKPEPSTLHSTKPAEIATPMPKSCGDLKKMGYTLSGFFSIKGHKMMASVYCDFSKLPTDIGFQKWIGYIDVKSAPTYFYVQRNKKFDKVNTPITFHSAIANAGNAMNLLTGKFKALVKGTYFFSFSGLAFSPGCSNACSSLMYQVKNDFGLQVSLLLNGERIGFGSVQDSNAVANQWSPVTFQSTLILQKGDTVWVQISYLSSGAYLHDDNFHHTHFTGFMLEQEILDSL